MGNHENQYYTPKENNSNVSSQAGKTGISRAGKDNPTSKQQEYTAQTHTLEVEAAR